jgi:ankyrin repeat protein
MLATFQDTLHLLAWNGYAQEAYKGSMACKETWTDDRILFPKGVNMKFKGKTLLSILAEKMSWYCWWQKDKAERHLARIKHLLTLGADPDSLNNDNWSPLMETCMNDGESMELFKLLLTKKVNVNGCPDSHWNPLSSVASCKAPEKTRLLLEAGADPNFMCKGKSVLHLASVFNHTKGEYTECLKLLLKAGANPNLLDNYGCSPMNDCIEKGYIKYAKLMLEYGGIIEDTEELMRVAIYNKSEVTIKFLHQHGEPIPDLDMDEAIEKEDIPLIAMLLRCGACPITPLFGNPPLLWAIQRDFSEKTLKIVKLLCQAGADVNVQKNDVPFIYSVFNKYIKRPQACIIQTIEFLVSKGAKLPSKAAYQEMLACAQRDKNEFIELNRIMMKARMKK